MCVCVCVCASALWPNIPLYCLQRRLAMASCARYWPFSCWLCAKASWSPPSFVATLLRCVDMWMMCVYVWLCVYECVCVYV